MVNSGGSVVVITTSLSEIVEELVDIGGVVIDVRIGEIVNVLTSVLLVVVDVTSDVGEVGSSV